MLGAGGRGNVGSVFNWDGVSVWTDEVRKMDGDDGCTIM